MRLILLFMLPILACLPQARRAAVTDPPGTNLPAHSIGPNDLLSVSVYDAPELSRSVRVGSDGHIKLPMLKTRIKAEGYLPLQLEAVITEALEKEEILVGPAVTVTVAEYHSRPISIVGAVRNPLTFQAVGPTRLLDALGKAGGLAENSASEILVMRPAQEEGAQPMIQRIPLKDLINTADPALNIALNGGEEIRVPAAGHVFVVGNVKKPGAFALRDAGQATVLEMLALAEGLTPYSAKRAYIYRRAENGPRAELPVELESILKRKHADVSVLPDDILYIPDNKGRRMSMAALERVLMFGSTAGATALIYSGSR